MKRASACVGLMLGLAIPVVAARGSPGAGTYLAETTIRVPGNGGIAVDAMTEHVFVAGQAHYNEGDTGYASTLDPKTGAVVRTEAVGWEPIAIAVAPRAGRVFIVNSYLKCRFCHRTTGTVSLLDARSGRLIRTIAVGTLPLAVAVDETLGRAFILNGQQGHSPAWQGDGGISVLDTRSGRLLATIPLGAHDYPLLNTPFALLAVDPRRARGFAVVADSDGGNAPIRARVLLFDTSRMTAVRVLGVPTDTSTGVVVDERTGHAFVTGDSAVSMLDTRQGRVLRRIPGVYGPLVVDGGRGRVCGVDRNRIVVLDARTGRIILRTRPIVPSGYNAIPLAVDELTGELFVTYQGPFDSSGRPYGRGRVYVLDGRTGAIARTISVAPGGAMAAAMDEQTRQVFVTSDTQTVTMFDMIR